MSNIADTFTQLAAQQATGFIPFIMAGDPDFAIFAKNLAAIANNGADIIEIGMPFSDPVADGVTIQAAGTRALAAGFTMPKLFASIQQFRTAYDIPIVLMGYFNPILQMGVDAFFQRCARTGVDGAIIVDLPMEEEADVRCAAKQHHVDLIRLIPPTCDENRIKKLVQGISGYIYLVSVAGITGDKTAQLDTVATIAKTIRGCSPLPIAVGFGIRTAAQASAFRQVVDGVVVGSAIVSKIAEDASNAPTSIGRYCQTMAQALHG